jgi:hypothetical protein
MSEDTRFAPAAPIGPPAPPPDDACDLCAPDRSAVDALVAAGLDGEDVAPELRDRARRVAGMLDLLGRSHTSATSQAAAAALIDLTLARVQRQRAFERGATASGLSPNDEDALEALVGAGFEPAHVAPVLRPRATRQAKFLALLNSPAGAVGNKEELVGKTLGLVQSAIDLSQTRLRLEPVAPRGRKFHLSDLVTVAALLMIGTAAVWPMIGAMRQQAARTACTAGLNDLGAALGHYAGDKDHMPLASASLAGTSWWDVGVHGRSNSENLYSTITGGYVTVERLACPGNPTACRKDRGPEASDWGCLPEVSYSYQNMFAKERPRWKDGRIVVVVDGSPVVRRAVQHRLINPLENSANHGGKGQNALFSDGSVEWLTSPVLPSGDNIWLPRFLERALAHRARPTEADPITGTEAPDGKDDVFVGP